MSPTLSKAEAKSQPYCALTMRQKLGLTPGQQGGVSMHLWGLIYGARTLEEFEASLQRSIDELQKALEKVRGE